MADIGHLLHVFIHVRYLEGELLSVVVEVQLSEETVLGHPLVEHFPDNARLRVPRPGVGLRPVFKPLGHPVDVVGAGLEVPLELGVLVLDLHELVHELLPTEAGAQLLPLLLNLLLLSLLVLLVQ